MGAGAGGAFGGQRLGAPGNGSGAGNLNGTASAEPQLPPDAVMTADDEKKRHALFWTDPGCKVMRSPPPFPPPHLEYLI